LTFFDAKLKILLNTNIDAIFGDMRAYLKNQDIVTLATLNKNINKYNSDLDKYMEKDVNEYAPYGLLKKMLYITNYEEPPNEKRPTNYGNVIGEFKYLLQQKSGGTYMENVNKRNKMYHKYTQKKLEYQNLKQII
jgi:hypothetical protein